MSITSIPDKGLVFEMDDYVRLRTSIGGPDFWFSDYQLVLLEKLAPFLPRMEYNSADNTVTASMVVDGQELMSTSRSAGVPPALPEKELKKLCKCLADLQAEVEAPDADPDLKCLIQAFRLPDPARAPEMYRVYGKGKLAIIWGMEKIGGSSVSVVDPKVQVKIAEGVQKKTSSSAKWRIALLLLAAAGIGAWCVADKDTFTPPSPTMAVPADDAIDALVRQAIYKVHILQEGKEVATATAFAVSSDGLLMTNEHVAQKVGEEGVSYQLESTNGTIYNVTDVLYHDAENDLALIKADASDIKYLKLRTEQEPKRAEYIYILGYPLGAPTYFLTTGHITAVDDKTHSAHFFHDAAVSPGSSGSPVVDTEGHVIGVVIGNISDEEKQAQQLNVAVWVGTLKNERLIQPESGHLELPKNTPVKEVASSAAVTEPTAPNELPQLPAASDSTDSANGGKPAGSSNTADEATPQELADGAANDAKAAEQAAKEAQCAKAPEKAAEAAKEAKAQADNANRKADIAGKKADESGKPGDAEAAKKAREEADKAEQAADEADDAARKALQNASEQNPGNAAKEAGENAKAAADDANKAAKAAAAGEPDKARDAAADARDKANDAKVQAKGAQRKADATKKPEDKKAADDALEAARKADEAADKAEQVAAAADPEQAVNDAADDADDAEKAVEKVKVALQEGKPEVAQKAADEAQRKADEADNKARGASEKAGASNKPQDIKAAQEAKKHADRAKKAAEKIIILLPRKVSISAPGGLSARVVSHKTNADGTEHVVIHVDTTDLEQAEIKGVKLGADNNVEIDIPAGGEHVPYTIRTKGNPIPTSSSIFINVQ